MFPILAAAEAVAPAAPAAPAAASLVPPHWIRKPNGEDFARLYPDGAVRRGLNGRAIVECKVTDTGGLTDCQVISEAPANFGFGAATVKLAEKFRMSPLLGDGHSAGGGTVRIPIMWQMPGRGGPDWAALPGVTACAGQIAHQAELDPHAPGAWRAVIYWTIQMESLSASMFMGPAKVETDAREARLAAAAGTLNVPRGWDLKTCLARVPK